jgi:hypothetical protein
VQIAGEDHSLSKQDPGRDPLSGAPVTH